MPQEGDEKWTLLSLFLLRDPRLCRIGMLPKLLSIPSAPQCTNTPRVQTAVKASNTSSYPPPPHLPPPLRIFPFCYGAFLVWFCYPSCTHARSPFFFSFKSLRSVSAQQTVGGPGQRHGNHPFLGQTFCLAPASQVPLLRSCQDPGGVSHDPKTRRDQAYFLLEI